MSFPIPIPMHLSGLFDLYPFLCSNPCRYGGQRVQDCISPNIMKTYWRSAAWNPLYQDTNVNEWLNVREDEENESEEEEHDDDDEKEGNKHEFL